MDVNELEKAVKNCLQDATPMEIMRHGLNFYIQGRLNNPNIFIKENTNSDITVELKGTTSQIKVTLPTQLHLK